MEFNFREKIPFVEKEEINEEEVDKIDISTKLKKQNKSFLDTEKKLFNKLPKEEINKRILKEGTEEAAIQSYGLELHLKSIDGEEKMLTSKERESEIFKKLEKSAQNVVKCLEIKYDHEKKKGESLVLVTDAGVPLIVRQAFIEQLGLAVGNKDLRVIVSKKPEQLAESFGESIGQKLISADKAVLLTSLSRTHSKESRDALLSVSEIAEVSELHKKQQHKNGSMFSGKTSIFSITDAYNIESLTEGAVLEDIDKMWERIDKFLDKFKDSKNVLIKTEKGTNLRLKIKEGTIASESGRLAKPGNVANFPFGEVGCVPDWNGTDGVFVVDGLGGKGDSYLEEPLKFYVESGTVVKIEGGKEADEYWKYLEKIQSRYEKENPESSGSVFKLAEFAFGMNKSAWRINEKGEKILPPTPLEGEKSLGTIHIALGNNALLLGLGGYGKDDSCYNSIDYHGDQIILNPDVVAKDSDGKKIDLMTKGKLNI